MPAKYYGGKSKGNKKKISQPVAQTQKQKRETAFAKPGTGQFSAGALTEQGRKDPRTNKTVAPQVPTRFTRLPDGRTGTTVDQLPAEQTPIIEQSTLFSQKLAEAQKSQSETLFPGEARQDFSNPPNPGVLGAQPPQDLPTPPPNVPNAAQDARGQQQTSVFGARIDQIAARALNTGFDIIQNLGNGDFARGITSLMVLPVGSAPQLLGKVSMTGTVARNTPGIVTKETLAGGGVKTANTLKQWFSRIFTREKLMQYTDVRTGRTRQVLTKEISPIKAFTIVAATGGVLALGYSILKDTMGGQATGQRDVKEELGGAMMTYSRDMFRDGNYEAGFQFLDMAQGAANDTVNYTPFGGGVREGSQKFADGINAAASILREHYSRTQEMEAEGINPQQTANFWEEYHTRVKEAESAQQKADVDYYNSERLRVEQEILRTRTGSRKAENASRLAQIQEEAAFWLEYKQKVIELEKQQQEEQAKFWLEYRKMVLRLQEDSRGSTLGFGLLG